LIAGSVANNTGAGKALTVLAAMRKNSRYGPFQTGPALVDTSRTAAIGPVAISGHFDRIGRASRRLSAIARFEKIWRGVEQPGSSSGS
jgi:hypothetical protein